MASGLRELSDEALRDAFRVAVRKERIAFADWLRPMLPLLAGLGTTALVASAGVPGQPEFYRAAATIIPTLLLTLAVQGGFFRLSATAESPMGRAVRSIQREALTQFGVWDHVGTKARFLIEAWWWGSALWSRQTVVVLLLGLGAAEGAALYPLVTGTPSPACLAFSCGGISGAFVAIAMIALFGNPPVRTGHKDDPDWVQVAYEMRRRRDAEPEPNDEGVTPS